MLCFCKNKMKKVIINKIEFYECSFCGYLSKINRLSSDDEKKRYDQHVCDDGYLKYMNNIFNIVKPYLINGKSLDYGCGQKHALADILNSNNYNCDYYDLYYYPQTPSGKYDNIIMIEVFEHIADIDNLMKELKSMLNPKGKVIIMTQVKPSNIENWWYLRDTTHISFVDYKTMELLALRNNYKLEFDSKASLFIFSSIE